MTVPMTGSGPRPLVRRTPENEDTQNTRLTTIRQLEIRNPRRGKRLPGMECQRSPTDLDAIHRDKNIDKEVIFQAIESALASALKKHYGEESQIVVNIDRKVARSRACVTVCRSIRRDRRSHRRSNRQASHHSKVREAERDTLYDEYEREVGQLVTGIVQRQEGGAATVQLANTEAILPAASKSPASRITPTSACGPRFSRFEGRQPREGRAQPDSPCVGATSVRTRDPRDRRWRDRDSCHLARARLSLEGRGHELGQNASIASVPVSACGAIASRTLSTNSPVSGSISSGGTTICRS